MEQTLEQILKQKRTGVTRQYVAGKYRSPEEFKRKYFVLQQTMDSDYYFNLLSESARNSFLIGEPNLTDIFDKILCMASEKNVKKMQISLNSVSMCIERMANSLVSVYDTEIFYNIVSAFANNLDAQARSTVLDSLRSSLLKRSKNYFDPSREEKEALYSLAGCLSGSVNMPFLFEKKIFPLPNAKELFLSFQSGTEITGLLTSLIKDDRIAARSKILSLVPGISDAEQCNMFFKLASGRETVYFDEDFENNRFQLRKVSNGTTLPESDVVRDSRFSQSSLFGILMVQASLKNEMSPDESQKIKNLLRTQIVKLFAMANKREGDYLKYIIPLSYNVNTTGLDIDRMTVLDLAKSYFSEDSEVIEKLNYLERIYTEYRTNGIRAARSLVFAKEPRKVQKRDVEDDEKTRKDKEKIEANEDDEVIISKKKKGTPTKKLIKKALRIFENGQDKETLEKVLVLKKAIFELSRSKRKVVLDIISGIDDSNALAKLNKISERFKGTKVGSTATKLYSFINSRASISSSDLPKSAEPVIEFDAPQCPMPKHFAASHINESEKEKEEVIPAKSIQEKAAELLERMKSFDSEVSSMKASSNLMANRNKVKKLSGYVDEFMEITKSLKEVDAIGSEVRVGIFNEITKIISTIPVFIINEEAGLSDRLKNMVAVLAPRSSSVENAGWKKTVRQTREDMRKKESMMLSSNN